MFTDRLSSSALLDVPTHRAGRTCFRELDPDEVRSMPVQGSAFVRGFHVELADPTGGVSALLADKRLPWLGSGLWCECLSLTVQQIDTRTCHTQTWRVVAGYFDRLGFSGGQRPLHRLTIERYVEGWNPVVEATLLNSSNAAPLFATSRPPGLPAGHCHVTTEAVRVNDRGPEWWQVRHEVTIHPRRSWAPPADWSALGFGD